MIRLLADECVAPKHFRDFAKEIESSGSGLRLVHILDRLGAQGVPDDDWVEAIATEGGWIVLTADLGRGGGPRLPTILPSKGVTGVFMTPAIHRWPASEKIRAVRWLLEHIERVSTSKPGTRFKIMPEGSRFRLEVWPRT